MDPLFSPDGVKSPSQILAEYQQAESPAEWLRGEVADFFDGPAAGPDRAEERSDLVDHLLEADMEHFDAFVENEFDEHDLVSLTVAVHSPGHHSTQVAAFKSLPTPLTLLMMCCHMCDVGDEVIVEHSFASGHEVTISSKWPFGMHEAVVMTTPNPGELEADGDADDDWEDSEAPSVIGRVSLSSLVRWAGGVLAGVAALGVFVGVLAGRSSRRP